MAGTKKKVNKRKYRKNKRRTKRMKLKIKNLGKKIKTCKRIQYGCSSKKKMKGGGPIFQPLTDFNRTSEASSQDFLNKFYGNDPNTNENLEINPINY